jgi:hypothetical protein
MWNNICSFSHPIVLLILYLNGFESFGCQLKMPLSMQLLLARVSTPPFHLYAEHPAAAARVGDLH